MSSSFQLTLDTVTSLAAKINGGKAATLSSLVTLELDLDTDAVEVKIWGDINPLDPGNAGVGETEAGAEWLPAKASFPLALTTNPAPKHLHVRVRDDAWNEATADASIQLGEEAPLPVPRPQRPRPAKGKPEPRPREHRRRLVSVVRAPAAQSRADLACNLNADGMQIPAPPTSTGIAVITKLDPVQVQTGVHTSTRSRLAGIPPVYPAAPHASAVATKRDGPELIAILEALDII